MNEKHDIETALPPLILLNAAQKSGALSVQPLLALEFLRKYQTRAKNPTSGWVQELGQGSSPRNLLDSIADST